MSVSALPVPDDAAVTALRGELAGAGVDLVLGHFVNSDGIHLAKTVRTDRVGTLLGSGLGASPTWNVFAIDAGIAFTPSIGALGDLRLRTEESAIVPLDGGLAWAPLELAEQDGTPYPVSNRAVLRGVEESLADQGLEALVGHELEFVLTDAAGDALPRRGWTPYGAGPLLDVEPFLHEVAAALDDAGLGLEQLHAEYAAGQFELSLAPATPVVSADRATLARFLVCRVARRHGLRASFSPVPFPGTGNSGAHLHLSLAREGRPLFGTDGGPFTAEGGAAVAGILRSLPSLQGILAGSVLSSQRLLPGHWAGAWLAWGTENRETAVRFVASTAGNPRGANVEVKIGDPSANVYGATAAVLAVAARGIADGLTAPEGVEVNPAELSDEERERRGIGLLDPDPRGALDLLAGDSVLIELLGERFVETAVAARRYEFEALGERSVDDLASAFRLAWSI